MSCVLECFVRKNAKHLHSCSTAQLVLKERYPQLTRILLLLQAPSNSHQNSYDCFYENSCNDDSSIHDHHSSSSASSSPWPTYSLNERSAAISLPCYAPEKGRPRHRSSRHAAFGTSFKRTTPETVLQIT